MKGTLKTIKQTIAQEASRKRTYDMLMYKIAGMLDVCVSENIDILHLEVEKNKQIEGYDICIYGVEAEEQNKT